MKDGGWRGTEMEPYDALENVTDYPSFLVFVQALVEDWEDEVAKEKLQPSPPYGPGANGWENGTIGAYLEAALRCEKDHAQLHKTVDKQPSWREFAQFLYGGKIYE